MADNAQNQAPAAPAGIFKFIQNKMLRSIVEVVVSAIPGGAIFLFFVLGTGFINIYTNIDKANNIFAATYIPVICVLPLVIGILGPLILERVRQTPTMSLRASIAVSFLSAFAGSFLGAVALLIAGVADAGLKPFGSMIPGFAGLVGGFIVLVAVSTLLSTIGGALIVILLKRAEV